MAFARPAALLAALLLAGCGAGESTSAGSFEGEERKVAEVVDAMQAAGRAGDADELCSRVLASSLVDRMAAGTRSCTQEVERALGDADDSDLTVRDVAVAGTSATAQVRDGQGRPGTLRFVRERAGWRVSAL